MAIDKSALKGFLLHRLPWAYAWAADWRDRKAAAYGEPELGLLPHLVRGDRAALDVGANTGAYSYWLLQLCPQVIAVEPNPELCALLRRRFGARLRIEAIALGAEPATATLMVPPGREALGAIAENRRGESVPGGVAVTVAVKRLDDLDLPPLGFVKIDVEGYEVPAIDGGRDRIARDRPTLLIEAEERHRPGAVAALRALLEPLGYRGVFLDHGILRPIADFDAATMQDRSALNAAGTHRLPGRTYLNNFIFLPDQSAEDRLRAGLAKTAR